MYWDDVAKAPYGYNASQKLFVTYDDKRSMALKTTYALDQGLNGIMFWEITNDTSRQGLLHTIDAARKKYEGKGIGEQGYMVYGMVYGMVTEFLSKRPT